MYQNLQRFRSISWQAVFSRTERCGLEQLLGRAVLPLGSVELARVNPTLRGGGILDVHLPQSNSERQPYDQSEAGMSVGCGDKA